MENEGGNGWLIAILIGALLFSIFTKDKYEDQTAEEWFDEYDYCESSLENYQTALDEVNENIEGAKSYAWESYDDMGYALDNLETVEP